MVQHSCEIAIKGRVNVHIILALERIAAQAHQIMIVRAHLHPAFSQIDELAEIWANRCSTFQRHKSEDTSTLTNL
jgi:hypothetical protein